MKISIILSILLFSILLSACSTCNVPYGGFTNFGGSEEYIRLDLNKNHTFKIRHEVWEPGKYEDKEIKEIDGEFSCEGRTLFLTIGKFKDRAELFKVGDNPLDIDPKNEALQFKEITNNNLNYLQNEILYKNLE